MRKYGHFDPVPHLLGLASVIIVMLFVVFAARSNKPEVGKATPSIDETEEEEAAILDMPEKSFSLKKGVKLVRKDVAFRNDGGGKLYISDIRTSSSNIKAQFVSPTQTGPEVIVQDKTNWKGFLAPNEEGSIKVSLRSSAINWNNPPDYTISLHTSDPNQPEIKIIFSKNYVEPENTTTGAESTNTGDILNSIGGSDTNSTDLSAPLDESGSDPTGSENQP